MAVNIGIHNGAEVQINATNDGELEVRAIIESELEHASAKGSAYCWTSADTDIDAGDTVCLLRIQAISF